MSVGTFSAVIEIAVGAPLSLADPLGIWSGEANVTGDLTGGIIEHGFMADDGNQLKYVYLTDWLSLLTDTTVDPGEAFARIVHHHELANITLDNNRFTTVPTRQSRTNRIAEMHTLTEWLHAAPVYWRRETANVDAQRMIVALGFLTNNNGQISQPRAGGRFWDARILSSPAFWRVFGGR